MTSLLVNDFDVVTERIPYNLQSTVAETIEFVPLV